MAISEYSYLRVIKQIKRLVPDFKYNRKAANEPDCNGYYWADTDYIYLKSPKDYESVSIFSRVLLHELAHWSMASGKGREGFGGTLPFPKHSKCAEWVEEIVAERSAERLSYSLGFRYVRSHPDIKDYTAKHRRRLKRQADKGLITQEEYKDILLYINRKTDRVVDYILNYSSTR
jgi:antirestriction protein ArdC